MKVYLLIFEVPYEGDELLGIFSKRDLAVAKENNLLEEFKNRLSPKLTSLEVEKLYNEEKSCFLIREEEVVEE